MRCRSSKIGSSLFDISECRGHWKISAKFYNFLIIEVWSDFPAASTEKEDV